MTHTRLRIVVSAIAVGAIIARYCFGVNVDGVGVGLLCLVFLPWLAPLIKSVEIPGIGKIEMQEIKEKANEAKASADEAKGAAQSADRKVELALAGTSSDVEHIGSKTMAEGVAASLLDEYAAEYNQLRNTMPAGSTRTSALARIVSKMIKVAPLLTGYDVAGALKDEDKGKRLSAYAFLYARPDRQFLDALVSCLAELEDSHFGQYWGILAVQRVIGSQLDQQVPEVLHAKLSALLKKLQPGTDRYYELYKVVNPAGGK